MFVPHSCIIPVGFDRGFAGVLVDPGSLDIIEFLVVRVVFFGVRVTVFEAFFDHLAETVCTRVPGICVKNRLFLRIIHKLRRVK